MINWCRKEMYLLAGIAASVKVAKMMTRKNRFESRGGQISLRHAFTKAVKATP